METELCVFEYFLKPKKYPIEKFGKNGITKLFLSFSTKYMYPNLYLIATDGELDNGKTLPVIKLRLFPNRKMVKCEQIATVFGKPLYDSNVHLPPMLSSDFGCCPTLIISTMKNKKSEDIKLFADYLKKFLDAKKTLDSIKKYKRNRSMRIRTDFSYRLYENKKRKQDFSQICDVEAIELAKFVLTKNRTEIPAFFTEWAKTVEFLKYNNVKDLMELEEFTRWFCLISGIEIEKE